jgi:beta-N-acetylhexosaminidase
MQMDAIARTVGSAPGAVTALAAGADSVLISHSVAVAREAVDRIEAAVADGSLPLARLQEAYHRVLSLRKGVAPPLALDAAAPHPGVGREIGRAAVTLVRGTPHIDAAHAIVLSFQGTTTEGVQGTHSDHASLREFAPALQETFAPLEPDAAQTDAALAAVANSGRRPIVLMRRAHVYASQAAAIARVLAAHPDAVVVSTREPFDSTLVDGAQTLLLTYGDDRPSLGGLADVLFGGHAPSGSLPLEIVAVA